MAKKTGGKDKKREKDGKAKNPEKIAEVIEIEEKMASKAEGKKKKEGKRKGKEKGKKRKKALNVITSYSIHYTKLYDIGSWIGLGLRINATGNHATHDPTTQSIRNTTVGT